MIFQSGLNPFASPPSISRSQAAAVSYASIGVRIGDSAQFMLVLAQEMGRARLWSSAARIALETKSGRIVRTAGLPANLNDTIFTKPDPLAGGFQGTFTRQVDFADRQLYGIAIRSRFSKARREDIEILGAIIKTVHVRESCECQVLDWSFENHYWADVDTGFIWRSAQTVHPALDPIHIDILRPPAG